MTTRAEFLAPLIETWPDRALPPTISRTELSASGEVKALDKPTEVTNSGILHGRTTMPSQKFRLDFNRNEPFRYSNLDCNRAFSIEKSHQNS